MKLSVPWTHLVLLRQQVHLFSLLLQIYGGGGDCRPSHSDSGVCGRASRGHLAFSSLPLLSPGVLPAPPQRSHIRIAGGKVETSGLIMHLVCFPAVASVAGATV